MNRQTLDRVADALGVRAERSRPLGGGQIGSVVTVRLADGREVVAKTADGVPLSVEARMLRYLATETSLPVPAVLHADDELMLLEMLPGTAGAAVDAEVHAADLLAELHEHTADAYGFGDDTLIGPFRQPNGWWEDWPAFFGEQRLRYMAGIAADRGELGRADVDRVRAAADALPRLLDGCSSPSIIHGDVWSGNVLSSGDRVTGYLDPALYYADPEVELAFIELFDTFGSRFFDRYRERRGIRPGYEEVRRDVYQLYPLLVHVAVFGVGYLSGLHERLHRIESRL